MRSFKRLLISALVSAAVCSHITQAISTNTWIYDSVVSGVITIGGVAGAIAFGVKNYPTNTKDVIEPDHSSNSISEKEAFNERVELAKKKIIKCIGEKKYEVLDKIRSRTKRGLDKYLGIDPFYLKDVDSVIVTDENKQSVELYGERLSSFLNSKDEKILDFFLPGGIKAIIDDALNQLLLVCSLWRK